MPIVSISEAARLVNKSRKTIYKHIQKGTLSTVTTVDGSKGVDTSELIRVYGIINIQKGTPVTTGYSKQKYTLGDTQKETHVTINNQSFIDLERELVLSKLKIEQQEKELNYKQQIIDAKDNALSSKQETIDTLKGALKLLEHKQTKDDTDTKTISDKEPDPPLNEIKVTANSQAPDLFGRLKNIFSNKTNISKN